MREVKAFIREKRANEVMQALRAEGFKSLTVSEAEGTGNYTKKSDSPSLRFPLAHSKMSKLEIVCKKEDVENIVQVIHEHGGKGEKGEGLIYVSEVLEIYKVRTGKLSKEDIEL
ncbi:MULTISPECIES: P-II family nitrogen regulator [Christiangramia]|uniref:Nitrogen regulatory protein P-II n=1 Tax=Christiangramia flava JLT2011 TaxID=1229726 RepID=A0A1L7IAP0_9FLAO|nr:P-II family nitrogen regulator [Christiangramia flava]APU70175.1 Nitrogen regulatory protein P-II [Christiangramia flava JLT2011]OSS39662.1 Nitrogen regulatory protein P-II [Christiangramia flava JLT2011]